MSADVMLKWKSRILTHQQQVRQSQPPQQTSLFDLTPDPDQMRLRRSNRQHLLCNYYCMIALASNYLFNALAVRQLGIDL
jgi:hypothetical protein